jgi:hypothetical protein
VNRFDLRTRLILLSSTALVAALTGYLTNAGSVATVLLTAGLAFVGIEWLLSRRLRSLAVTLERLRHDAGPTAVRAVPKLDELDHIGSVVDDLAAALRQRQAEQRVTETRLATIVNIASTPSSPSTRARIVLFNHGAEQIFGSRRRGAGRRLTG